MKETSIKILVVDDDRRLRDLLNKYLSNNGFLVDTVKNTDEAAESVNKNKYDILIVDRMMPGKSGTELLQEIRRHSEVPVLMLTAMGEAGDRVGGLESGADDYLVKPFEPKELLLRINNIMKREKKPKKIVFGEFMFNTENGDLYKNREFINLTSTELNLLKIFILHIDKPVTRQELSKQLNNISERSVDVQVNRLRKKIEDNPKKPAYLQSAWGMGYIFRSTQRV